MAEHQQTTSTTEFPVSVIMERTEVRQGRWVMPKWEAVGVIAGEEMATSELRRTLIRSEGDCEQYLWTGLTLALYKDAAESYWFNLSGDTPALYVACCENETNDITPVLVTADSSEAGMHEEGDDLVFSVSMPPELHQWLERYVVENYVPQEKKKRKRKNWVEDSHYEQRPQTTRPRRS